MKKKTHIIRKVHRDSIAEEIGLSPGDILLSVNGICPEDIFDYSFACEEEELELLIEKASGEQILFEIEKDEDEDLGLVFSSGLMDEYRSCRNRCIFCFIDQMPPGMRETLYFKDDDARLSFLQGNYITLTNLTDHDLERMIRYHMEPVNISVHTTDPDLRKQMLGNRFAGKVLAMIDRIYEAGLEMNGQIVLCPGYNDGDVLEETLRTLARYLPVMKSVSVVPVGLTRYREKLPSLQPVDRKTAEDTIGRVERLQEKCFREYGLHFAHASDEFYLLAGKELPEEERYDGYPQLANGVGTLRLLEREFREALAAGAGEEDAGRPESLTVVTGVLAAPFIREMASAFSERHPAKKILIRPVVNRFFGESITVAGLLTGKDILEQLQDTEPGDRLLLPDTLLRSGEDVLLDDVTVGMICCSLHVPVNIVESNGYALFDAFCRDTGTAGRAFPGYEMSGEEDE